MIRWKTSLFLLVILLVLILFIFLFNINNNNKLSNYEKNCFFSNTNNLKSITFHTPSNIIYCALNNGIWTIGNSSSSLEKANNKIMNRLVSLMYNMNISPEFKTSSLSDNSSLSDFGLENPYYKIIINDEIKSTWFIGDNEIINSRIYLMNHDMIYTASPSLKKIIPKDITNIIDMRLITDDIDVIDRINLKGNFGFFQLIKNVNLDWSLSQPINIELQRSDVLKFIQDLKNLHIDEIINNNVSDFSIYGFSENSIQVDFLGIKDNIYSFVIGDEVPGRSGYRYARRDSESKIVIISDLVIKKIDLALDRFKSMILFNSVLENPDYIELKDRNYNIILHKNNNKWKMQTPFQWNVSDIKINQFIKYFNDIKITKYNSRSKDNLDLINLKIKSGDFVKDIKFFRTYNTNDNLFVSLDDNFLIHEINKPQEVHNFLNPLFYKDEKIFNFNIDEASLIEIDKNNHKTIINIADVKSHDYHIINRLVDIKADPYIAAFPSSLDKFGLNDPYCFVKINFSKNNHFGIQLIIGDENIDGRYAMLKGRDIVFILSKDSLNIINNLINM